MTSVPRHGRLLALVLGILGIGWCSLPASAQGVAVGGRRAAASLIPQACRMELARLCPEIDPATPQGRSAAICLKPFKTSLSLPCRKVVRAAFE